MSKTKMKLTIRNSTAEFLIYTSQSSNVGIEVLVQDENVWLPQKLIAKLFGIEVNTTNYHLKEIFKSKELQKDAVIRNFRITANDGKTYNTKHYNLEAVIAIGFKVNSERAVEFRRWANGVLKNFAIKGYVLDSERLKNGAYLNKQYYEDLLLEIRDIRASERNFYQKITDIYATAVDYDLQSPTTRKFFANVQNKMHYAVHQNTAAELVVKRADHNKDNMGLSIWKKAPKGKILKSDVSIAKNYLKKNEIKALNRIVTMYLDYAEDQAEKNIPMTMRDWAEKLDTFLKFNEKDILKNAGKVTGEIAKTFAESEFEKYRPIQDKLYQSDFDKEVKKLLSGGLCSQD
ncbi:virulence RhuM family protein [Candidatus Dojkabacteria bacterium]|nr:virulence RhuM family protein [Candidatus Dojkabacteria bacterium]